MNEPRVFTYTNYAELVDQLKRWQADWVELHGWLADTANALKIPGNPSLSEVPARAKAIMARLDGFIDIGTPPAPQPTTKMVGYHTKGATDNNWGVLVAKNWNPRLLEVTQAAVTKEFPGDKQYYEWVDVPVVLPTHTTPSAPTRTLAQVEKEIVELAIQHASDANANYHTTNANFSRLVKERDQLLGK